jgi:FkbM family methyltransferase
MTFITFAQNYEDVMLWRALKDIPTGFYIDVGANDPVEDSVTKAFYDRGWRGINVEPLQVHIDALNHLRPRDINLAIAAGETEGELELWDFGIRGWGSMDHAVVSKHKESGREGVAHVVPVLTLEKICETYVDGDIHFLKIDVEGFELSVIKGMNFNKFRPWIVVIEVTTPNSKEENDEGWAEILLKANYSPVYADGVNRFYLADERSCLSGAFKYPPNVFDELITGHHARAIEQEVEAKSQLLSALAAVNTHKDTVNVLSTTVNALNSTVNALNSTVNILNVAVAAEQLKGETLAVALEAERITSEKLNLALHAELVRYRSVETSLSWKITKPLRWGNAQLALAKEQGVPTRAKAVIQRLKRSVIFRGVALLKSHPEARTLCVKMAIKLGVYDRLVGFYTRNFVTVATQQENQRSGLLLGQMPTARAMTILEKLKLTAHESTETR